MSKGMYDSRLEQLADWLRQEKDEARPLPNRIDRFLGWPCLCGFTVRVRPFLPALPAKSCVRAFL